MGRFLASESSPLHVTTDEHIEPLLVIAGNRTDIEIPDLPEVFRPITKKHKIQGLYE